MIFDTNVLIYAERGHESAKEAVLSEREPAISAVTYMEYVSHCRNKEELQVFERMLETLRFAV